MLIFPLRLFIMICLVLCAPYGVSARTSDLPLRRSQPTSLTIMADSSLTVPLNLIARTYALEHDVSISTVFFPSNEQIQQISDGEDANIFITARTAWMEEAQQKGLIDVYSRVHLARNQLVLVASTQHRQVLPSSPSTEDILAMMQHNENFILALGSANTSAEGHYALQALRYYGWDRNFEPNYHFLRNIPQLASMITSNDVLGIIFRSDVPLYPNLKEVFHFAPESHRPITYEAAVIAGDDMEEARVFLSYLQSHYAQRIFARFGLEPV